MASDIYYLSKAAACLKSGTGEYLAKFEVLLLTLSLRLNVTPWHLPGVQVSMVCT